jgi:uracil-DNA glycosylase
MLGSGQNVAQAVLRPECQKMEGGCSSMKDDPSISTKHLRLRRHVESLYTCRKCSGMQSHPVSGGPILSRVMLVGQAPGVREPILGRPFAWTAGKAMFKWFEHELSITEREFRRTVYMAAVCRCFPGKNAQGGDRVPSRNEIALCGEWLRAELAILEPGLVIAVGKLAIGQFLNELPLLTELVGRSVRVEKFGQTFDLVPLPHPSGASPWHRIEPGKTLTKKALALIRNHPAWRARATSFV